MVHEAMIIFFQHDVNVPVLHKTLSHYDMIEGGIGPPVDFDVC